MINFDKFLASFITEMKKYTPITSYNIPACIKKALEDQGLKYKDGEIVKTQRMVSSNVKEDGCGVSEDKRIMEKIIATIHLYYGEPLEDEAKEMIAWLKKQGEQKPVVIIPKFRVGDEIITENEESLTITRIDEEGYWSNDLFICDFDSECIWDLVEQKPVDKVEPKFKIGDLVVDNCDYVWKIEGILNDFYLLEGVEGGESRPTIEWVNKTFHLWSIKDAKDGDVLSSKDKEDILIYKSHSVIDLLLTSHISFSKKEGFCPRQYSAWDINEFIPATKEQRDLLSQKMHEAGYTFDFEKKELKKINNEEVNGEDYGIDSLYHAQRILEKTLGSVDGYQTDDGILSHKCAITAVKKLYEQKPAAWSEEDRTMAFTLMRDVDQMSYISKEGKNERIGWLNSLDEKFTSRESTWSEEDDRNFQGIIDEIEANKNQAPDYDLATYNRFLSWLKSLKQRYTWKPSDEQMEVLVWCRPLFVAPKLKGILESLINDLKKLKGE